MAENNTKTKEQKKTSFMQGVKSEWKKINWVSREDLVKETGIVVVLSLILGVIITAVDSGALRLIDWILNL